MAGHSKWANIKHRKGAQDKRRAKIFTKIIKEITIASKQGGPDLAANSSLRLAVSNAKGANMPKDTIEKAIKRGQADEGEALQEVFFEGYAPHGIAIFIEATTDNNNRTVANVRAVFNKCGGNLGTNGSLSFLFDRVGVFEISLEEIKIPKENFEMQLIENGLEDLKWEEDRLIIYTLFDDFGSMQKFLEEQNIDLLSAEFQRIPKNTQKLDLSKSKQVLALIEKMDEEEDVASVYHNLELTDELRATLESDG